MRIAAMKSHHFPAHVAVARHASDLRKPAQIQQDIRPPASARSGAHVFDFSKIGASAVQRKPSIGAPDDAFEREADAVADKVMRMSEPASLGAAPVAIQRKCAACEDEEKIQTKRTASDSVAVAPNVDAATRAAGSSGQPLPRTLRAYFEPRFGYDFSGVRIHAGGEAAHAAHAIQARAYTLGHDIVFGAGEYAPATPAGRRLLAHELTHVVQQGRGASSGSIQRARIPYRQLTWADFQGTAPPPGPEAAGVFSAFDIPGGAVSPDTAKTKEKCKVDGKNDVKVNASVAAKPADFDTLAPYMDQDKSWLQVRLKDDGVGHCTAQAAKCERDFDNFPNAEKAMCEPKVEECRQTLRRGQAFVFELNGERVTIDKRDDCEMKFPLRCQAMAAKGRSVSEGAASASSKRECKGKFLDQCKIDQRNQKAALLRHEQGHFDITKAIADLAQQSLKQKAATMKFSASGCGQQAAIDAVMQLYNGPGNALPQLGTDWQAAKERAQREYDGTQHGSDAAVQARWETRIKGGLRDYAPASATAPATPTAPGTTTPAAPPSTPAPTPARKP